MLPAIQRKRRRTGDVAGGQGFDIELGAKYEPSKRFDQIFGATAAQYEQQPLFFDTQQMEQRANPSLGIQPGVELPLTDRKRLDVVAELCLREAQRIGTIQQHALGRESRV
ncbi:MAG: hypothetical protein ABW154_07150 [Dyella sp.]